MHMKVDGSGSLGYKIGLARKYTRQVAISPGCDSSGRGESGASQKIWVRLWSGERGEGREGKGGETIQ